MRYLGPCGEQAGKGEMRAGNREGSQPESGGDWGGKGQVGPQKGQVEGSQEGDIPPPG